MFLIPNFKFDVDDYLEDHSTNTVQLDTETAQHLIRLLTQTLSDQSLDSTRSLVLSELRDCLLKIGKSLDVPSVMEDPLVQLNQEKIDELLCQPLLLSASHKLNSSLVSHTRLVNRINGIYST